MNRESAAESNVRSSDTVVKYFRAVSNRHKLYLKRAMARLSSLARRKTTARIILAKSKSILFKNHFGSWSKRHKTALLCKDFMRRKARVELKRCIENWTKAVRLSVKSARLRRNHELTALKQSLEKMRFVFLHGRTLTANFQWRRQEKTLKELFYRWRSASKKRNSLRQRLFLFKARKRNSALGKSLSCMKYSVSCSKTQQEELAAIISQRLRQAYFTLWRRNMQTEAFLLKLKQLAKLARRKKIYKAFFEQVKKDLLAKLKTSLAELRAAKPSFNANYKTSGLPSKSRNGSLQGAIIPNGALAERDADTLGEFNYMETFKKQTLQNIMELRNQASSIKCAYNGFDFSKLDFQEPHDTTRDGCHAPELITNPRTDTQQAPDLSVLRGADSFARMPRAQFPYTSDLGDSGKGYSEQIINGSLALIESKVRFLKLNKDSMTEEDKSRLKNQIKTEINKLKLQQQNTALNTQPGFNIN